MPFVLISGIYHSQGFSPDGDSVRFRAADPAGWEHLNRAPGNTTRVKLNALGMAQLRLEAIDALARSGEPAVLLLDVVLGYGADPDPAGALVPALTAARSKTSLPVVIALVGTEGDPQVWSRQADALAAAGAAVFASNAAATRYALDLLGARS